ncbi:hypothetical protein TKK_0013854 [Trichogramma kaykai]
MARMKVYEDSMVSLREQLDTVGLAIEKLQVAVTLHPQLQSRNLLAVSSLSSLSTSTTDSTITTSTPGQLHHNLAAQNHQFKFQWTPSSQDPGVKPFSQSCYEAMQFSQAQASTTPTQYNSSPIPSTGLSQAHIADSNSSAHHKTCHKSLQSCTHVFLRAPPIKKSLDPPYVGPFKIHRRASPHFYIIRMTNKRGLEELKAVSTLRIKPAHGTFEDIDLIVNDDICNDNFSDENIECDYTLDVPEISDDLAESTNSVNKDNQSVPETVPKISSKKSKDIKKSSDKKSSDKKACIKKSNDNKSNQKKEVRFHTEHTYTKKYKKPNSRNSKSKT